MTSISRRRKYKIVEKVIKKIKVESVVPVDSGTSVVTSSISRICWLGLSEVLIVVGLRAYIHRDECACVFVSVCVCIVFLKKKVELPNKTAKAKKSTTPEAAQETARPETRIDDIGGCGAGPAGLSTPTTPTTIPTRQN